jgi:formate dehydrogenase subunit gamma
MATARRSFRLLAIALGLCLAAVLIAPAATSAQERQPLEVNPTAQSVKERELLKELNKIQGRSSLPDAKTGVLEQPAGRDWRQFHQVTLRWVGAVAILGMFAVLILFYLIRGMVRIEQGRSGRTLVRFNAFERFVHWMTASCFIVLAISGLNITFGRELLTPLFGPARDLRHVVAVGEVCSQLSELPVHYWRRADVPHVDCMELPVWRRFQMDC